MIKYFLISSLFVVSLTFLKLTLVYIVSLYYKEPFYKNINISYKDLLFEFTFLTSIMAISFWFFNDYLVYSKFTFLLSLLFISLIPSYNFIVSPIKYLILRKEYLKNEELTKIINDQGYNYNIVTLKGNITNAYATGILPFSKTILIGENLLKKMSKENLISIVYHEIGHLKYNHLLKLYFCNLLLTFFALVLFFTRQTILLSLNFHIYEPLSIFLLGLFYGLLIWYIPGKFQYKLELQADCFASKIVGDNKFEEALVELDSLSNGEVAKGGITHPNLIKRTKNLHRK